MCHLGNSAFWVADFNGFSPMRRATSFVYPRKGHSQQQVYQGKLIFLLEQAKDSSPLALTEHENLCKKLVRLVFALISFNLQGLPPAPFGTADKAEAIKEIQSVFLTLPSTYNKH